MKFRHLPVALLSLFLIAQEIPPSPDEPREVRLPSGRLQRDEIVKADHAKNIEDARELVKLAQSLKADLDKQGQFVLSIGVIRKTEEIEKVARRIRSRLKRL